MKNILVLILKYVLVFIALTMFLFDLMVIRLLDLLGLPFIVGFSSVIMKLISLGFIIHSLKLGRGDKDE